VSSHVRLWAMAAVVGVAVFAALWLSKPPPDPIRPGQSAPGFTLPRLEGGAPVSLGSLRGHVVLVNFWATWCKPCEEEMPAMQRLYDRLAPAGFQLLAVSEDASRQDVVAYRKRLSLTFPILLDADKTVSQSYQTYRYPESFLIDRDGRILAHYVGPRDWDSSTYQERLEKLVSGSPSDGFDADP
jgi:peroxiredoxin